MHSEMKEAAQKSAERLDLRTTYADCAGRLYGYALALLGRADEAEDVVHDVFAAVLRLSGEESITRPISYLLKAVRRRALELRKRRQRETPLSDDMPLSWVAVTTEQATTIDVDRALKLLPEEQREVVTLKVLGELSFREIGKVLGISPNTVYGRYRLAMTKLRAVLKEGDDDV